MATYKGIGYDTANGKYRTGTSSDDIEFDSQINATDGLAVTGNASATGQVSGATLSITGDATIGGDLNVTGDIISGDNQNVVIKDPAIDLGVGATSAQSTGFSFIANAGTNSNTITSITASTRVVVCNAATSIPINSIVQIRS